MTPYLVILIKPGSHRYLVVRVTKAHDTYDALRQARVAHCPESCNKWVWQDFNLVAVIPGAEVTACGPLTDFTVVEPCQTPSTTPS